MWRTCVRHCVHVHKCVFNILTHHIYYIHTPHIWICTGMLEGLTDMCIHTSIHVHTSTNLRLTHTHATCINVCRSAARSNPPSRAALVPPKLAIVQREGGWCCSVVPCVSTAWVSDFPKGRRARLVYVSYLAKLQVILLMRSMWEGGVGGVASWDCKKRMSKFSVVGVCLSLDFFLKVNTSYQNAPPCCWIWRLSPTKHARALKRRLDGGIAVNVCDRIHEACACDV